MPMKDSRVMCSCTICWVWNSPEPTVQMYVPSSETFNLLRVRDALPSLTRRSASALVPSRSTNTVVYSNSVIFSPRTCFPLNMNISHLQSCPTSASVSLAFMSSILRPFPLCCMRHSSATSCPGTEFFCLKPQSNITSPPIGATMDGTHENTTNTTGKKKRVKERREMGKM